MVLPTNSYSLDLPERCLDLFSALLPFVEQHGQLASRYGGRLTTTLTLAMAVPMLTLPIERIERQLQNAEGYADDRVVARRLVEKIEAAVLGKRLSDHPIFADLDWSFMQSVAPFNIARGLPEEIAEHLDTRIARSSAKELQFTTFLSCLRNGLSHGGILYLNEHGQTTGGEARMFCFVSARQDRTQPKCDKRDGRCPTVVPRTRDLRLLRISEVRFREFLFRWVHWLKEAGLENLAAEEAK
ncbi:hypothetical protein [Sinorhizobium meliloti]|uniref:hypothetical protein n=1 Tax=Rhizobium meliloti TaxID=382 RepID=UPI003F1540B6